MQSELLAAAVVGSGDLLCGENLSINFHEVHHSYA